MTHWSQYIIIRIKHHIYIYCRTEKKKINRLPLLRFYMLVSVCIECIAFKIRKMIIYDRLWVIPVQRCSTVWAAAATRMIPPIMYATPSIAPIIASALTNWAHGRPPAAAGFSRVPWRAHWRRTLNPISSAESAYSFVSV